MEADESLVQLQCFSKYFKVEFIFYVKLVFDWYPCILRYLEAFDLWH